MAYFSRDTDVAFQAAGAKPGLEIWCIENLRLVPVPKSSYGRFYTGSAYLVLHTVLLKSGTPQHDIHYWSGKSAKEEDSILASDKALELDEALGSHAVQYQEVQGQETELFLSYFKPCIIPVEGIFSVGPVDAGCKAYQPTLFSCKGDRVAHVKEVPFTRSSLNHTGVFILDTASKIFLFCGCDSSILERAKALEVVQFIKEDKHNGNCDIATIDDGKFVGDPDVGEFWSLFGGYAPIPKDLPSSVKGQPKSSAVKLFWITTQGNICQSASGSLSKKTLDSGKCYMLDCDVQLFVWMGRNTNVTERKTSMSAVEELLRSQERSLGTQLTFLTEGSETASFKTYFGDWPQKEELKLYEEGREKVAAIFKQHGYDVKELPDDNEDIPLSMDFCGDTKVWRVDGDDTTLVSQAEQMKLYSGDCYIVQYIYHDNGRERTLFYAWLGRESVMENREDAISRMAALVNTTKGDPVMARVVEGQEPLEFFLILKTLIIFKGGMCTLYKMSISEKGIEDETYNDKKTALFQVQGTSSHNMQAIQVDQVSGSLNSSYCYILKTEMSTFTWLGNLSTTKDHDLLDRMLDLINPMWQPVLVREGSEPDEFWNALGGKAEYPTGREIKGFTEDPHLFVCSFIGGDFKVKEILNFTQDDLTTEDVLVLDCHPEIYVWIGCHSSVDSKQQALDLGMKFLKNDILDEKLSVDAPVYVVTEGCEPPTFTQFFEWDPSKANMLGNSFERKLALLKGKPEKLEAPLRSSWKVYATGTNPDGLRRQSLSVNGYRSSSPVNGSHLSTLKSSEIRRFSSPAPISKNLFTEISSPHNTGSTAKDKSPTPDNSGLLHINQTDADADANASALLYPYERLKVTSDDPVTGIDVTRREAYLSNEEFQEKFGMLKASFYQLPKWRQGKLKRALHLF